MDKHEVGETETREFTAKDIKKVNTFMAEIESK